MSMIDLIGFQSVSTGRLFKKLVTLFIFATALCCAYHVFVRYLGKLLDSVHYIAGRSNANMSWIFF